MRINAIRKLCWQTTLALALSICSPLLAADMKDATQPQLNVVFHGMFAFVVFPDHIEAIAPDISDHVYKAGAWAHEMRLGQGVSYSLSGVSTDAPPVALDPASQVVLSGVSKINTSSSTVFCVLNLPMPDKIVGLRRAKPAPGRPVFAGKAAGTIRATSFPLLETFVYRISDMQKLGLGHAFEWQPEITSQGTVNLHIWAEPEVNMDPEEQAAHPSNAFNRLMALFPGIDLRIEFGVGTAPDATTNVRGLEPWEESTLLERSELIMPPGSKTKTRSRGSEIDNCIAMFVND